MATVTGMTTDAIAALVANFAENLVIDTGVLKYTKPDGSTVVVGNVPSQTDIINQVHPVGSIFMTTSATNPAITLGVGTWNAWGQGRVPVCLDMSQTEFNGVEKTGGEKTHVLTTAEMPSHVHSLNHDHPAVNTNTAGAHDHTINVGTGTGGSTINVARSVSTTDTAARGPIGTDGAHNHTVDIPMYMGNSTSTGGDTPHNNLQPYITCYMWKRVA